MLVVKSKPTIKMPQSGILGEIINFNNDTYIYCTFNNVNQWMKIELKNKPKTCLFSWWRRFKCKKNWHDYTDSVEKLKPMHFYTYTCKHCNQEFEI